MLVYVLIASYIEYQANNTSKVTIREPYVFTSKAECEKASKDIQKEEKYLVNMCIEEKLR